MQTSLLAKYAPALMPLAIALVAGLQVMLADNIATPKEAWQFAALAAGAFVTWAVPLLKTQFAALLKILANVVAAAAVIFIDMLNNGEIVWDFATITFVVLGLLQAFAAQLGVGVRLDAQKAVIDSRSNPGVPNITSVDKPALQVVAAKTGESDTMVGFAGK